MKRRLAVSALIAGVVAMAVIPAFAAQITTTNDGYSSTSPRTMAMRQ